jgi:hypothetical protein
MQEQSLEQMIAEYKEIHFQTIRTSDRKQFLANQVQMEILGEKIKRMQKSQLSKELG